MSQIDDEINRLYQLPLAEFTTARNRLASGAGSRAAEIRRLPKPNAAAWAVNQIFWRRPKVRDRLDMVSARLRRAHDQRLSGKSVDLAAAEAEHRAAVAAAVDEARTLLKEAGDAATPATLQAVQETLETVLWRPLDGRLTRPLKPTGLEALAALKGGSFGKPGRPAEIVPFTPPAGPARAAGRGDDRKQREAERRREAAALARELRQARAAEARAAEALARARERAAAAERERTRLSEALEAATIALADRRSEVDRARKASELATAERTRLDERHKALGGTG